MKIQCPHCNEMFEIDDVEAAKITSQLKDSILEQEVNKRVEAFKKSKENDVKTAVAEAKADTQEKYLKEINSLKEKLTISESNNESLKRSKETEIELAVMKATAKLESEFNSERKRLNEELDYYKDLKSRMSTKMVGETLEQHCLIEFNKIRNVFPRNIYFEKDNEVSGSGSKGDFIYRETDDEGVEIISIMFEMKNEIQETEKKHKNEDFLKELDKDRREKKCEYAVLVSLLESDNDFYNNGIVDVSYKYDKMYVVRPQFFIPIITILRNAALTAMSAKHELERVKNQNIDITHFEEALIKFKDGFSYNYNQAHKRFAEAIDEIDKSIDYMNRVKDSLLATDRQLRLANNKADDITIQKLCKNNPTMIEKFEALKGDSDD